MFKLIKYHLKHRGHMKIVKILILLAHNPNSPDEDTPNSLSSVQKLSKSCLWTDIHSSNAKIKDGGETPIYWAAWKVNTEIFIILAPRTDNPNASDKDRYIPNN